MVDRTREFAGVRVPTFIYGTAWKEERTSELVVQALRAGFRGLDTANQRTHYREVEVGRVLVEEFARGTLLREEVFVQTKFTFQAAQDHRIPYDPAAPVAHQVTQSVESSLSHLGLERVDSYLLHGPSQRRGLGASDIEAWSAMEALHDAGKTRFLGVSNVAPNQLTALLRRARVRPAFVQNRCFAALGWDAAVRDICAREGLVYQGFSLLTANGQVGRGRVVRDIAQRHGRTPAQVIFRFALQLGMIPLTGTTNPHHMGEDLSVYEFELTAGEVRAIERAGI
ncbi:MAG: aldo/keto reductase family protein [Nitriliruptorales bacterium]